MEQNIPRASIPLMAKGAKSVRGLDLLEEAVGVKLNTKLIVAAILDAAEKAQSDAKTAKGARSVAAANLAMTNAKVGTFLALTRDMLKPKLGSRYSVAWNAVGFVNNSLRIPSKMDARLGQLKVAELYLDAHPDLASPGVVTTALAGDLYDTFLTDISESSIAATTLREKTLARDEAMSALEARLRKLFQELKQLMSANDPRWLEFGFNVPGDSSVPQAPEELAVTPGIPGHVSASWVRPVNSDRFRVFRKVLGLDDKFMATASTAETAIELDGMTSGAHVQLYVTAINEAGESLPSAIVEVVVP